MLDEREGQGEDPASPTGLRKRSCLSLDGVAVSSR